MIFESKALSSGRCQLGFHRSNLHRLTFIASHLPSSMSTVKGPKDPSPRLTFVKVNSSMFRQKGQ